MIYSKVIIGAGIYGLYAALHCAKKDENIIVLEYDSQAFSRATFVNQARVHNGYHYPRSYSTANKSSKYFKRFNEEFDFAINNKFKKIYATSKEFSWTSAEQFKKFCDNSDILCEEINPNKYFKKGLVDGAFETEEYAFDALLIRNYLVEELKKFSNVKIVYNTRIDSIKKSDENTYVIETAEGIKYITSYVLNATYASTNQILKLLRFEPFKIKYELCEIIVCDVSSNIRDVGITVMDGPFFSVMPFGLTGSHSLTSVTFTPHATSYDSLPTFKCQENIGCNPNQLENCNICKNKPESAWKYMHKLSMKYLIDDIDIKFKESLFSMKPILMASEIDDSRPTVIREFTSEPRFVSVLSGKINTIYDLLEVL